MSLKPAGGALRLLACRIAGIVSVILQSQVMKRRLFEMTK